MIDGGFGLVLNLQPEPVVHEDNTVLQASGIAEKMNRMERNEYFQ